MPISPSPRYDPWQHVRTRWPEVDVVIAPLTGRLLGQLRYPVISLRDGSSPAQHRSTLAHELVHLERGVRDCGPWAAREEDAVEATAARRLIELRDLTAALRELGSRPGVGALARALDVDTATVRARLQRLSAAETAALTAHGCDDLWRIA